uniref:Putative secreted protein n=1 Tax=Anopheles darlingi TaxID=43151 RepID=A0A2M4DC81_ANODA
MRTRKRSISITISISSAAASRVFCRASQTCLILNPAYSPQTNRPPNSMARRRNESLCGPHYSPLASWQRNLSVDTFRVAWPS